MNSPKTVSILVDERLPVYAPTAFSPDGNGVNDIYRLEFNGRVREVRTFQIFNRWGTMVHDGPDGWMVIWMDNRHNWRLRLPGRTPA